MDLLGQAEYEAEGGALDGTALRLTSLFSRDDWELAEIVVALEEDDELAGTVLQRAKAVAGRSAVGEVAGLAEAVLRLGAGPVLRLAVAPALRRRLEPALPLLGLDQGVLWRHGLAAALFLEELGRRLRPAPPPDLAIAALVHDAGFLAVEERLAHGITDTLDHSLFGEQLARRWGLPATVSGAIAVHHRPEAAPEPLQRRADLLSLAESGARLLGTGLPVETTRLDRGTIERLGIGRSALLAAVARARPRLKEMGRRARASGFGSG